MNDSGIIARLIYRSYAGNQNDTVGGAMFVAFIDAMELYAKTRVRELIDEGKLEPAYEPYHEEPQIPDEAAPAPEPELPADTHTHTPPGPMTAEAKRPAPSPVTERAKSAKSSRT